MNTKEFIEHTILRKNRGRENYEDYRYDQICWGK